MCTRFRWALLTCVLSLACAAPPSELAVVSQESIDPASYLDSIDERYIVLLEHGSDPRAVAARHGIRPFLVYEQTGRYCGFAAQLTEETLEGLGLDPDVRGVQSDRIAVLHGDTTNGVARMKANRHAVWLGGVAVDVDIAILDTGIDSGHEDLDVMGGRRFVTGDVADYEDGHGHGTHVAGTAAALDNGIGAVGVAPGARLWAGKVVDDSGVGTMATAAAGVDWAAGLGIPVISLSMGFATPPNGDCSSPAASILHLAVCNAVDLGSTVIASAGNDAADTANYVPAAYDEVITVSALADFDGLPGGLVSNSDPVAGVTVSDPGWAFDCTDATSTGYPTQQDDALAVFSNVGSEVDLVAPGFCVISTSLGGYEFRSGTSMAAAHVAGAAAVYLHNHPGANAEQVRAGLLERANPFPCDGSGGSCAGDGDGVQEPLVFMGHLEESFELASVGTEPACVSNIGGSATGLVSDDRAYVGGDSGSQSLALEITSLSTDPDYARVEFCLPDDAETHFHTSFAVNFQQLVDWNPIVIFADGNPGEMLYWWWVDSAGLVSDDQQVGSFATDTWHRVTIDIDRTAGTATFDVDGIGTTSLLSAWDSPTDAMKCLAFTTWADELQSIALDDVLVTSFDHVPGSDGFITYVVGGEVFRIEAREGASPVNISTALDALAPGNNRAPAVSKNGAYLTIVTDRFEPQCAGWECLALLPSNLSSAETVFVNGSPLRPYQGRAAVSNDGALLVYSSQSGPNNIDLVASRKVGSSWTSPVLLTGGSNHGYNEQAVISADASTILFDCGPTPGGQDGSGVCEVGTDGTGFRQVVHPVTSNPLGSSGTFAARHADYTASGGIVFEASWAAEQLWVLNPGSTVPEQVIPAHFNDNSPCALPGGGYASLWLGRPGSGGHELTITSADGSSFYVVTPNVDVADIGMSCHE